MRRAGELASRGLGSTSPNPPVGALILSDEGTLGEGFHRVHGEPHAEIEALADAARRGADVRGATMYVTLEPCTHQGRTPPCTQALVAAGLARVVIGTHDPNPKASGGAQALAAAGVAVTLADDPWAASLVEEFIVRCGTGRPFVRLKLATALDGMLAPAAGMRFELSGALARDYVRELRIRSDAVMVGAGTVRIDDPRLTVRPPHARRVPYRRIVACEREPVPLERAIFEEEEGYAPTLVLAPAGARPRFAPLAERAELVFVGDERATSLDLTAALDALAERGIASILCEGGPTLAARLLERALVDRIEWIVAPRILGGPAPLPALGTRTAGARLQFDRCEPFGDDLVISARCLHGEAEPFGKDGECSAG
ncbi:MAG: bifunctional diaminohydroxyphosphoribosylaminopyrimidine deaminase/5-amino-6-(5-phosphoribosylamino)uracil reductase RibD [Vulcanimicrobiaceae bacterium]